MSLWTLNHLKYLNYYSYIKKKIDMKENCSQILFILYFKYKKLSIISKYSQEQNSCCYHNMIVYTVFCLLPKRILYILSYI